MSDYNWTEAFLAKNNLSKNPIKRRLRNGIVFKEKGHGETAVFQVQPVNYLENGIWRPIDVTLQNDIGNLKGAPGLAPRITEDGEIRFVNKSMRMKTQSIGILTLADKSYQTVRDIPDGYVDGNRIIRQTQSYLHETILTEKGVKEQITIHQKPKNLSGDFMVLETEIYDTSMPDNLSGISLIEKEGLIIGGGSAWDSSGENTIPLKMRVVNHGGNRLVIYTGVPVSWLDEAVYPVVIDPTYSEQPDGTDGVDSYIAFLQNSTNYGSSVIMLIGEMNTGSSQLHRSLIKFDLTSIPTASPISAATLSFWITTDQSNVTAFWRVYRQKKTWVEAEVTWDDYASGSAWTAGGGFDIADCETTDIGELSVNNSQAPGTEEAIELDGQSADYAELIAQVGSAPSFANNGWLVRTSGEIDDGYHVDSSDSATPGERPQLVITYTVLGRKFNMYPRPL